MGKLKDKMEDLGQHLKDKTDDIAESLDEGVDKIDEKADSLGDKIINSKFMRGLEEANEERAAEELQAHSAELDDGDLVEKVENVVEPITD